MEQCSKCSDVLTEQNWQPSLKKRNRRFCKACNSKNALEWARKNKQKMLDYQREYQVGYQKDRTAWHMWYSARRRALEKGIPFDIAVTDIFVPERCPVFGVAFETGTAFAPTLDRLKPSLGYVVGNIAVISRRANSMKSDGTLADLRLLVSWLEGQVDISSVSEDK